MIVDVNETRLTVTSSQGLDCCHSAALMTAACNGTELTIAEFVYNFTYNVSPHNRLKNVP